MLFVASILTLVWSMVLTEVDRKSYFLYVLTGLAMWSLLARFVRLGASSLRNNEKTLRERNFPLAVFIGEELSFSLLNFALVLPMVIFFVALFGELSVSGLLVFLLGLFLAVLTAVGLALCLGTFAFLFGDVQQIILAVMRLSFLITPIIWRTERLGQHEHLIQLNPFFSYLDLCRSGLMSTGFQPASLFIATAISIVLLGAGIYVLSTQSTNIRSRAFAN